MGTIRYRQSDGAGLYNHEGYLGHVFEDGSACRDLRDIARTVGWCAMCECGWQGAHIVPHHRRPTPEWEDVPELEREWIAHTDPLLANLPPTDPALARAVAELEGLAREIKKRSQPNTYGWVLGLIERRIAKLKTGGPAAADEGANGLGYGPEDIF